MAHATHAQYYTFTFLSELLESGKLIRDEIRTLRQSLGMMIGDEVEEWIGEYDVGGDSHETKGGEKAKEVNKDDKKGSLTSFKSNPMLKMIKASREDKIIDKLGSLEASLARLENDFIRSVANTVAHSIAAGKVVGAREAAAARGMAKELRRRGKEEGYGSILDDLEERPIAKMLKGKGEVKAGKGRLFVLNFPGDTTASQVSNLREEVRM